MNFRLSILVVQRCRGIEAIDWAVSRGEGFSRKSRSFSLWAMAAVEELSSSSGLKCVLAVMKRAFVFVSGGEGDVGELKGRKSERPP